MSDWSNEELLAKGEQQPAASDLPERLRDLATALEGCEWDVPLCAAQDCERAAELIEAQRARIEHAVTCLTGDDGREAV